MTEKQGAPLPASSFPKSCSLPEVLCWGAVLGRYVGAKGAPVGIQLRAHGTTALAVVVLWRAAARPFREPGRDDYSSLRC